MWILALLLQPQESKPSLASKVIGCFFLMLSSAAGAYFLFQALALWVGYFESGGIVCGLLAVLGSCFLFREKKKKPSFKDEASHKILNFVKNFDIEKILKDNALTLSLFSLGIGILLSQVKGPKKPSLFYKIFK